MMKKRKARLVPRLAVGAALLSMLLSPFSLMGGAAPVIAENSRTTHTVNIDTSTVIQEDFLGVGINVIPTALMPGQTQFGYTEAHWEMDRKRINSVQPKVARVWFQIDWMEPEKGTYTWDSMEMNAFYKYMDAFKEAGTEIELNFGWKVGSKVHDWFVVPDVDPYISAPADLDAYAVSASELLQELIFNRGYDNVKYLTFYNEPNGNWDFEVPGDQMAYYAEMVRKTSDQLAADGIRELVEIWGPEETGAPLWTKYMADHIDEHIDGYSFHVYGESYVGLGQSFEVRQSYVGDKPIHLTEFGFADDNASNWDAGYANSVIQSANMGVKSALMWQLNGVWSYDPFGGTNGSYTMWDSLILGLEPRKTFYSAGMLNRYIPAHSQVLEVTTGGSEDIRAAAFRTREGEYTILLETKPGTNKEVSFDFGGEMIGKTFRKIAYKDDVVRTANAILPPVSGTFQAGSSFTDSNIDDAYNVVIYTTEPAETQVEVSPINPTLKSGEKLQLSANVIDNTGGVTWSIIGANNGSINKNTGVYHAPQVKDQTLIAVKATSIKDPSSYGIVLVKVLPKSLPNTTEVPTFSLSQARYSSSEALFLSSTTNGAEIRYTLDGSTPTQQSPLYERRIILDAGDHFIKAKAFKGGLKPSGTVTAFYQVGQVSNAPDGYQFCMYEGQGDCYFEGEAIVAYGADGLFNYAVHTDSVSCSSDVFGDPAPGQQKRCFYSYDIPDETPVVTFFNAGFELPATTSARPGPMSNGWDFSDRSGVQHNNGPFQATPAPQGQQTAYLKTDGGVAGWIGQSINFKPGTYQMEFKAAKRTSYGGTQSFDVYFDDQVIGSFRPDKGDYVTYRTEPFTTEGGRHYIKFAATTTEGDNTAFIDAVKITHPVTPVAPYLANASFESPVASNEDGMLTGITAGWSFNAKAGIIRNGSSLGAPNAPIGVQAAYLVADASGTSGEFSQSVQFPSGVYAVSFQGASADTELPLGLQVLVDDELIGSFSLAASSFNRYETAFFTVEEGERTVRFAAASGSAGFIDNVGIERIAIPELAELANGSFESPTVNTGHGVLVGVNAGWRFNNHAGIIRNGSVFEAADAPDGTQAAYLQTLNGSQGEFSQDVVLPAGHYVLSFEAARRSSFGGQQSFAVYFDDQQLGSFTPISGSYAKFSSGDFVVTKPGKHTIRFVATTTIGDNTAFIDAVAIKAYEPPAVPEPQNAGFESPAVTAGHGTQWNFQAGWSFNGLAGFARNGSVLGQPDAPEGVQTAYLMSNNGGLGEISQQVEFGAGTYTISFQGARRDFGGQQSFNLMVGDQVVGSFAPTSRTAFESFVTEPFTIAAGHHMVRFIATAATGDNTAFIDNVRFSAGE